MAMNCFYLKIKLRRAGEFLALQVPGLAEGRPSLLIGDSVVLSNSTYSEFSPSYQGYIHEVRNFIWARFIIQVP